MLLCRQSRNQGHARIQEILRQANARSGKQNVQVDTAKGVRSKKIQIQRQLKAGYVYTDNITGVSMVKYHVNACPKFQEMMKTSEFGGNLSNTFTPTKEETANNNAGS